MHFCGKKGVFDAESMVPPGVNPTPDQLEANFDRKWVISVSKKAYIGGRLHGAWSPSQTKLRFKGSG